MKVHAIQHASRVNGPGRRSVVWTQGCTLSCAGCQNPFTHSASGGTEYDPVFLAEEIFAHCAPGTEGLTISGGEPIQQAPALLSLILAIKARRPDWSVGMFSGYTHRELADGDYSIYAGGTRSLMTLPAYRRVIWRRIEGLLDFGIFGRFDRTQPTGHRALVSSANQEICLFSMRYQMSDFEPLAIEFSISDTGLCSITGFPV